MASVWEAWGVGRDLNALAEAAGELSSLEGRLREASDDLADLRGTTREFSAGLSSELAGAMRTADAVLGEVHAVAERAKRVL